MGLLKGLLEALLGNAKARTDERAKVLVAPSDRELAKWDAQRQATRTTIDAMLADRDVGQLIASNGLTEKAIEEYYRYIQWIAGWRSKRKLRKVFLNPAILDYYLRCPRDKDGKYTKEMALRISNWIETAPSKDLRGVR